MKRIHLVLVAAATACAVLFSIDLWSARRPSSITGVIRIPDGATGPESLAFDPDGEGPYTGVSDGRILKWQGDELGWLQYAVVTPQHLFGECKRGEDFKSEHLCGRPLGLQFNERTKDLYIADAYLGLLKVGHGEKSATVVASQAEGVPLHFTNSLAIAHDSGIVYFTDSSTSFQRREFLPAVISGDRSGRLMMYDPESEEVKVLLTGLAFPNGVVLSSDGSFLLVAETTTCRILKYSLRPTKGETEVLLQLPGFPDNIKPSPRGGFWVALHSRRGKLVEWFLSLPSWMKEIVLRFPVDINEIFRQFSKFRGKALAFRISEGGEILEVMENFGGQKVKCVSEVDEQNGTLWVGSVLTKYVGIQKL